jgi:Gpi18-like mannosyltransferase
MKETIKTVLNKVPTLDWQIILLVVIAKVLIIVFAGQAYQIISDKPISSLHGWFEIWAQWDANRYLDIARDGYTAVGEKNVNIAFFPLFPILTYFVGTIVNDILIGGFIVSGIASIAVGLLLRRLVNLDYSDEVSRLSVFFLFIFPTSYFLHIPYTESLFLAFSIGCFYAVRKQNWLAAGLLGQFACMSRINGLILLPVIAVELFLIFRETKKINWQWLWLMLIPMGFFSYLLLNYHVFQDPFAFTKFQKSFWDKELTWFWVGIKQKWGTFRYGTPSEAYMVGYHELFFVALGFACTVWSWFKLRTSYSVWMTINWLLFTSTSWILSVPRYTIAMFPIFILFAEISSKRFWLNALITIWSILLMSLFICRYVMGTWAF